MTHHTTAALFLLAVFGLTGCAVSTHSGKTDQPVRENPYLDSCMASATTVYRACKYEVKKDILMTMANRLYLSEKNMDTEECRQEAKSIRFIGMEVCDTQLEARVDVCESLTPDRQDIPLRPDSFVRPKEIGQTVVPNPYFPLIQGTTWRYHGEGQTTIITVTSTTRQIQGITCSVVHDVVQTEAGIVIEDTLDWYAQDIQGNVWYLGEQVQNYTNGHLTRLSGSWQAGTDSARAGVIMYSAPESDTVYRQEYALGSAEDIGRIITVNGTGRTPAASCQNRCLVIQDSSPLEPGTLTNKYYAKGIGLIMEVNPETGEHVMELIEKTNQTTKK